MTGFWSDWLLTVCLLGILNIYSATTPYKVIGTAYYIKQFYWMLVGMIISLAVCSLDYHILEDLSYWFYGFLIFLLVAVLVVGRRSMGATRWLNLGFFNIQPSELMKLVIIVTFARFFNNFQAVGGLTVKEVLIPLSLLALPAALIMKQPDLGTATLIMLIALSMVMYVGLRWSTVVTFVCVTIPMAWIGWAFLLRPYQKNRVLDFLNPERSRLGSGYHIIQSKIAVGSGGIAGKGFIKGTQSQLRFLPEQHTDFAFSVFAEEWGFIGCLLADNHLPLAGAVGAQHRPSLQRSLWRPAGGRSYGHALLAYRHQHGDGDRHVPGSRRTAAVFFLRRHLHDHLNDWHRSAAEHQYATLYVLKKTYKSPASIRKAGLCLYAA